MAKSIVNTVNNVTIQANEVAESTELQLKEVQNLNKYTAEINSVVANNIKYVEKTVEKTKEVSTLIKDIKNVIEELKEI
ncbi:hypothetical protein ABG79_02432 [Caloramator mitchellensis]|uniref:Methyl-accepting chemotaxis protein (MCP) signaling domain protein n=2 Tax=Caloramator mitchellensis TaxID=908809 RepID=A0A0R3JU48_CALMK|nr:hypothetical protein ABG79_02432 [Caloramator mitchellensis]